MVSLEELTLEDFQAHIKTTIKFSPYFNVIVGSTRSGKSSIVRGFDFLLYNNWYEDYQRFGSKQTTLTAKLSTGKIVTRIKSPKANKITITNGEIVERFEAFGFALPPEVTSTLGIIPIQVDSKDSIPVNIANQDDPFFLLYSTGTDRTKVLSRLSGLHWIDYALKDLNKDRRTKSSEIDGLKEANVLLLEKLKKFENLEKLKSQVATEKQRLSEIKKVEKFVEMVSGLLLKTSQWKRDFQEVQNLKSIDFPTEITRLESVLSIQETIIQPLEDLNRKLTLNKTSFENIKTHLCTLRASEKALEEQITVEEINTPLCPVCGQEVKQRV